MARRALSRAHGTWRRAGLPWAAAPGVRTYSAHKGTGYAIERAKPMGVTGSAVRKLHDHGVGL